MGRMLFFQLVQMVHVSLWAADLSRSGGIVGQGEDDGFGGFGCQSGSCMLQCLLGGLPKGLAFSVYAYFKNYHSSHVSDKLHTFLVYSWDPSLNSLLCKQLAEGFFFFLSADHWGGSVG